MDDEPPAMNSKEKKELALAEIVVIILGTVGLLVIIWLAWLRPHSTPKIDSYKSCASAGNAIQESYPEVCVTKDGKRFVNPASR